MAVSFNSDANIVCNMSRGTFTGRQVASVLIKHGYEPQNRNGSHLRLRYEHPDNEEDVRNVTVPVGHGELSRGTLRSIMEQAGGKDIDRFCSWVRDNV